MWYASAHWCVTDSAIDQCSRTVNEWTGHTTDRMLCVCRLASCCTLFIPGIFGAVPPQKKLTIPPNGCRIVCSESFLFGRDNESQIYHGNFLLMDNKHWKLFVIKQSKGCRFMHKMYRNTSGGRAPPAPAGRAYAPPRPLAAVEAYF